jgi:cytochrome P450
MERFHISIALLLALASIHRLVRTLTSPLRRLPSAPQPWIFKRLLVEPSPEQLTRWAHDIPNEGLITYRGMFNIQRVLVTTTTGVHDIFSLRPYEFPKPSFVKTIFRGVIGDGLIVVDGDQHKMQKRALQPAFKAKNIRALHLVFEEKALALVDALNTDISDTTGKPQVGEVDISAYLRRSTLDIIGMTGLGLDFDWLKNPHNELATTYSHVFTPSKAMQLYRALTMLLPQWSLNLLPLKRNRELKEAVAVVRKYARNAIEQRKHSSTRKEKSLDGTDSGQDTSDIIGSLMTDGHLTDIEALITQSMTFLGAGHETVHYTMVAAMYELGLRPDVQDRVRKELSDHTAAYANTDGSPLRDLDGLQYLSSFCNEVYRLHPSIPDVRRQSDEDTVICGQHVPKGTQLVMSLRLFNKSSTLWASDPQQFDPDRWTSDPALGGASDRRAFMTFGQGTRGCIGERFARAEVKCLVAALVSNFTFQLVGTAEDDGRRPFQVDHGGVTSKVVGGLQIRVKPI